MGILILGAFLAIAVGMGIGTFAASKLGIHEGIGQVAGVGLVALAAVLWMKADDRKRAQAQQPQPTTVTVTAGQGAPGSATPGSALGLDEGTSANTADAQATFASTSDSEAAQPFASVDSALGGSSEAGFAGGSDPDAETSDGSASWSPGLGDQETTLEASAETDSTESPAAPRASGFVNALE